MDLCSIDKGEILLHGVNHQAQVFGGPAHSDVPFLMPIKGNEERETVLIRKKIVPQE